jgi:L-threonylcarbamoyladenylate synthase
LFKHFNKINDLCSSNLLLTTNKRLLLDMYLLRDDILEVVRILDGGGLLCYPTDTIWGIGCDATNEDAIERLSQLKGSKPERGYIILVASIDMLRQYVPKLHPRVETLLSYHTRPLTLIYDRAGQDLPGSLFAPDGTLAIRVVKDPFCEQLITRLGRPIVSTAACKVGLPYPATFGGISSEILGGVAYVVKHRQDDKEPCEPSPVAKMDRHQELDFLRE